MTSPIEPRYSSPTNYTPRALADKILAARDDIEGERKQVTALFADVVGFTSLSEKLDPEDAHAVMRRCFDVMLEEVHRYEGTVTQFLGDGMFALFGAPLAHEDHAYRAVRAALGMQAALAPYQRELHEGWGIDFQVRVGLNSGLVVVGNVARDLSMEYLAIGDTVNLASRVQALAPPGSVAISERTQRLVRGHFVTRDLGEHDVKGKQRAIRVHEVVRAIRWRSRVDVYAEAGLGPLVGRERELELLLDRARTALAGAGQVVFIAGEPGIGKSRLLHELRSCLEQDEQTNLNWLVGRCVSYGADVAYLPIIDLLQDAFSIEEGDTDADRGRKLEDAVSRLDAASALPYLRYLLGVDGGEDGVAEMDPQLRKARIFDSVRSVLAATADQAPTVITIEDLHWLDRVSTELLSYLIEAVGEKPIALVLTYRRDWEAMFGDRPNFTEIELRTLTLAQSARVAEFAVSAEGFPPELEAFVHDKTEGNPFFVEEVVKSLVEAGVLKRNGSGSTFVLARPIEDVVVPDTIEGVIMARLDRLPEEPKRALQTAAVIGREFTIGLLERTANLEGVGDDYLRELKSVELIHERSLYPELAFMFRHALTHDVAYNSLLVQHRKALHRLVGAAIEEVYADHLPENLETLAYHWEQAQDWSKALDYLVKSGHKALAAFAPPEALRFFDRALAAVATDPGSFAPPRLIALHEGRGKALALLNEWDASAAAFQSMLAAAEGAADPAARGAALFDASSSLFLGHRFEEALDFARRARELALETDDAAALAGSLVTFGGIRAVTGKLREARGHLDEAKVAGGEGGSALFEGLALMWSGFLDHWEGSEGAALAAWTEGRRLGKEHGLPTLLLWTIWNQGLALCGSGRYEEALGTLEEHLELTERLGDKFFRCRTLNTLGWVYMDLCNWELALDHNRRGVAESRELGDPEIIRFAELNVADCYLAVEQLDAAQEHLERVERESAQQGAWGEEWMKWRYTQHLDASLGELFLARGDLERAQACAERCLTAAEDTRSRRNVVKARRLQGKALLRGGHLAEADRELDSALQRARAVGNPAQLRETLAAVARLREAQRRPREALASYDEALAVVEEVASSLSREPLAQTLRASAQVQALRDARATAERSA